MRSRRKAELSLGLQAGAKAGAGLAQVGGRADFGTFRAGIEYGRGAYLEFTQGGKGTFEVGVPGIEALSFGGTTGFQRSAPLGKVPDSAKITNQKFKPVVDNTGGVEVEGAFLFGFDFQSGFNVPNCMHAMAGGK